MAYSEKHFLTAIEGSKGFISTIADNMGCAFTTVYQWQKKSKAVKDAIEDERIRGLDFAEGQLFTLMKEKNVAAVIFYLKTQGKGRGYVEKQELDFTQMIPETVNLYSYAKGEKVSTNGLASNGTVPEDD